MGNLLAANSNLSGSVHHYRQALMQNGDHAEAYSSLRIIACYQKFHRSSPTVSSSSSVRTPARTQSLQPTCSKTASAKVPETVFICTKVWIVLFHF